MLSTVHITMTATDMVWPATIAGLFALTNFFSFIVGAETIAGGTAPDALLVLPGLLYEGAATAEFYQIYQLGQAALWLLTLGYVGVLAASMLEESDAEAPWG